MPCRLSRRIIIGYIPRRAAAICFLVVLLIPLPVASQEVPELQINSTAYIVLDAETGEIYAQKNAQDQRAIGSLTKVFTAVEALERASLSTEITTTEFDYVPEDASVMGFSAGETFTLEELLYGVMLPSGNDAAHAIARNLGKTSDDMSDVESFRQFVGWMNQRIQLMGLTDTHLKNPDGWGVPDHYSSAYDLATFTRYALNYPMFEELISTREYETSNGYELRNNNRMLTLDLYPDIVGGKTGYDWDAGWCLIEVARRGDDTMISVTLDGIYPDDWYDDNAVLLDYAFDEKEKREEQGETFDGDIAAYIDPRPVLIANTFPAAGSISGQLDVTQAQGTPQAATDPSPSVFSDSPTTVAGVSSASESNSASADSSALKVLAVAIVALVVMGVRMSDTWRRNPAGNAWSMEPEAALASQDAPFDVAVDNYTGTEIERGGEN